MNRKVIQETTRLILAALCLAGGASVCGQSLSELRREIDRLEAALQVKERQEQSMLERVQDLDREIGLRTKLVRELEAEKRKTQQEIQRTRKKLDEAEEALERRKEIVARRMVALYKRGRLSDLEILLTLDNVNQALVWLRYQQKIMEADRRNIEKLAEQKQTIVALSQQLESRRREQVALIEDARRETDRLAEKKQEQEAPLRQVRGDKEALLRLLTEKQRAIKTIEDRIEREERKPRIQKQARALDGSQFEKRKGKLPWPIRGRVVQKYGRQHHPVSNMVMENLGIEIEGPPNGKVKAVSEGAVLHVDWQRGMGNLVLVDHGGYYTVYGHLEVVDVAAGDYLNAGDVVGQVGESSSLYGSALHFEVWQGTRHLDPQRWLE